MRRPVAAARIDHVQYFSWGQRSWMIIFMIAGYLVLTSGTPLLALYSLFVFVIAPMITWRTGEPPILFGVVSIQWLSIATAVYIPMAHDSSMATYYATKHVEEATWFSLTGLLTLMLGMRVGLKGIGPSLYAQSVNEVFSYSVKKTLYAYMAAVSMVGVLAQIKYAVPGLSQFVIAMQGFKSAFLFLFMVTVLVKRNGYAVLIMIIGFETLVGMAGFFSGFKDVFYLLALSIFVTRPKPDKKLIFAGSVIFVLVLMLGAIWSEIKMDYRHYLSGGTGRQIVVVDFKDRVEKLQDMVLGIDGERMLSGYGKLLDRLAYTSFFGKVIENVPSRLSHTDGEQWLEAIMHVLQPRLLFPDKPALTPDVIKLDKYAGLNLYSVGGGNTEIPMGYMAETYIDFGHMMFLPILLLGLVYGLEYKYFARQRRYVILSYGAITLVLSGATKYESSIIKIVGGNLTMLIVMIIVIKTVVPAVSKWMSGK